MEIIKNVRFYTRNPYQALQEVGVRVTFCLLNCNVLEIRVISSLVACLDGLSCE